MKSLFSKAFAPGAAGLPCMINKPGYSGRWTTYLTLKKGVRVVRVLLRTQVVEGLALVKTQRQSLLQLKESGAAPLERVGFLLDLDLENSE